VTVDLCVGVSIDDANACTADSCDPATGLVTHTAIAGCCRNDSECSASSDCYVAKCTLGRSGAGTCSESLKPIGASCDSGMLGVCARGQTACTARGGYICDPLKDPSTDVCDGLDNDCDGEVDEGFNVGSVCSNGNPCKTGVIQCLPKTGTAACVETNLPDGTSCSDSNACTGGDKCLGGACVAGAPLNCDDGNVCTSDICDPSIGCDNKCLGKGTVVTVDGSTMLCQEDCGSAPLECLSDTDCESKNDDDQCNGKLRCNAKGKCELDPATIIPVPASTDPCKVNTCEPSTGNIIAKPANEGLECDDGKLLTINDKCLEGTCTGTTVECLTSADCSGDACSTRSCVANKCVATAVSCDDGNICTTDSCDPVLGCKHSAILSGQVNVCGGCADLAGSSLGAACGICSDGLLECDGANATKCVGASTLDTDKDGRPDVCDAPECGNGVVEDGESCDAGALNSDTASNACRTDCQWHRCGDGIVQRVNSDGQPEACDDGNNDAFDGCSPECQKEICTENNVSACDDGRACTRDFCDLTGSSPMCAVEDIADCCETDADCVSAAGCMIASCVNNSCVQTQDPTCCLADSGAIVPSGMVLSCNNGACVGTMACSSGAWSQCSAKTASGETCNGVDDDCNGLIDDGVVRECSSICGSGIEICSNGSFGTCNAPQPSVEICDNVDNDCDGMVDEDLGVIECPSGAIAACVGGAIPECPPQISNECDDGNPCTTGDTRDASGNCVGQPKVCVDSDTCTTDSCDMATGECKFAAIEGCGGDVGKKLDTEDASRIFDLEQTRAVALPFSEIRHVEIIGKNEMQVYYLFGCNSSGCGAAFMPMSALRGQAKPVFKLEAALADKEFVAVAKLSGKESYDILMRDQECLYVVPKVDVQLASPAQAELNVQAACLSAANACDEYTITDVQINDPAADGIDDILVKLNCIYPEADTDQPIVEDSSIKFVQLNNSVEKPGAFTAQIVQGQWKDASAELFKFGAGDLSVSMGADAVSTAVEKVFGVNYGSDVGEHFADDKFATGEENVAVSTDTGIRLAKVKTSAASKDGRSGNSVSFEPYPEAVEHYICRSPKDGMLPEKYSEPMVIRSVEMKTFGGPDLSAICSSGNERAAFFYPNINEAPSVRLIDEKGEEIPATGNIIGEEDQFVIAKGIDPTNDRLTYKWECKDSKGADCSAVFTSIKPEEMSILASNSKALIESGAPDMSINASEDVNPTVTKGLPIQGYSCPLTLKVTATDDGGMSSQASASFGCVIDGKYVDIKSTTKGTEGDVTGVGVTGGGLGWAAISGGGCSLVIRR